ncbi:MAG TPA: 4'-phosphopantetheinyl transferase superfamily protein [Gemmatimonadaceae bacterium]|nr:4'-phosphopantetheinyl transferase superfamily protein [Gemmatimonadaceae bacterium]
MSELGVGEVRVYTMQTGDRDQARVETRRILAMLLGVADDGIELEYGPKGKPTLRTDPGLYFSVSHAQGVSMVAVTRVAHVGVDVEVVRAVPMAEAILRRFLTAEDVGEILTDDNRDFRFVRAWTRAEATVKVRGASVWEAATPDPSVTVREVVAPEGYAASVAVAASAWSVTQERWEIYR